MFSGKTNPWRFCSDRKFWASSSSDWNSVVLYSFLPKFFCDVSTTCDLIFLKVRSEKNVTTPIHGIFPMIAFWGFLNCLGFLKGLFDQPTTWKNFSNKSLQNGQTEFWQSILSSRKYFSPAFCKNSGACIVPDMHTWTCFGDHSFTRSIAARKRVFFTKTTTSQSFFHSAQSRF